MRDGMRACRLADARGWAGGKGISRGGWGRVWGVSAEAERVLRHGHEEANGRGRCGCEF